MLYEVITLGAKRFEYRPVAIPVIRTEILLEMAPEVVRDMVVVEQRVVDVQKEYDVVLRSHGKFSYNFV